MNHLGYRAIRAGTMLYLQVDPRMKRHGVMEYEAAPTIRGLQRIMSSQFASGPTMSGGLIEWTNACACVVYLQVSTVVPNMNKTNWQRVVVVVVVVLFFST